MAIAFAGQNHARAQTAPPATARLEWSVDEAASDCRDPGRLAAQVERVLGRNVFTSNANADLVVRVHVGWEQPQERWMARITLLSPDGTRLGERMVTKQATRCESLEVSLAVVLALILDLPQTEQPATEPTPIHIPDDPDEDGFGLRGSAAVGAALGIVPGPALSVEPDLFVTVRGLWPIRPDLFVTVRGLWPIRLGMTVLLRKKHETQEAHTSFSGYWGRLALCPTLAQSHFVAMDLCGGGSLGTLVGAGLDLTSSHTVTRLHAQADLSASVRLRIHGPLHLLFEAGASAPLIRHTYTITLVAQEYEVHRPWPIVPFARLGLALGFGR
jgi:hypothetical protein